MISANQPNRSLRRSTDARHVGNGGSVFEQAKEVKNMAEDLQVWAELVTVTILVAYRVWRVRCADKDE